jgi:ATP-dependent DNA helicase Rep
MVKLNPQQTAAVRHSGTPLLVLAGAGSGKTGVITHKIAHLIKELGVSEKNIYAVTFTNKAAQEMKLRVGALMKTAPNRSAQARGLNISTFHTLGLRMLQRDCHHLGFRRGFSLMDNTDSLTALKELRGENSFAEDDNFARTTISRWKNDFITPEQALKISDDDQTHLVAKLYARYVKLLHAYNAVDFDDLISLPVLLLQENSELTEQWQNRVRHLLVDEYQDTNAAQYALVKLLVGKVGELTAVGDDDQSIYSWRGARPENLAQLQRDYPRLKLIVLDQNYRSTSRILGCANRLIGNNPHLFEKKLWSDLGVGDKLRVMPVGSGDEEADWVASDILVRAFRNRIGYGEFAILYRGNFQSRVFERALREKQIPYQVSGGTSFFDRAEIKDVLAYLRLLINPDDDTAFLRVVNTPRREIGANTLEKLGQYARQRGVGMLNACHELGLTQTLASRARERLENFANWITLTADNAERRGDPVEIVRDLLEDIRYEAWLVDTAGDLKSAEYRWKNVLELIDWIERLTSDDQHRERSMTEIVSHIRLMDILESNDNEQQPDAVNVMTLHAAKGLEFTHVYMVGVEEDLLPHRASIEQDTIEEERRLAYVGITRAQKTLTLCFAQKRQKYGELIDCEPSRFFLEMPATHINRVV